MNDTLEIPEHIRKAAIALEIFFKVNGINEWALMGIQSRNDCREQLAEQTQAAKDATDFNSELLQECATERATRQQLEQECKAWEESTRDTHNAMTRTAQAEARLAEALDHIRWLQPMAKGWAHAHESIASNHRIVLAADEFLSSTQPPLILAEVERLQGEVESWTRRHAAVTRQRDEVIESVVAMNKSAPLTRGHREALADYAVSYLQRGIHGVWYDLATGIATLLKHAETTEQGRDALKLKLEGARAALEKIATATLRDRDELKHIAKEALSQLNESK